jgi:hypothetical protein
VVSIVVSLIHDAQEIAILNGKEILSIETLNEAYKKRLKMLHGYIAPTIKQGSQTSKNQKKNKTLSNNNLTCCNLKNKDNVSNLILNAKQKNLDVITLLKEHITIEEVRI